MIRIRSIAPGALDPAYLAPFLQQHGSLSMYQTPQTASILAGDSRLAVYEFLEQEKVIGYAIVQLRHHILADIHFGPVVLRNDQFVPCVTKLRRALARKGVMLLRIFPPYTAPPIAGSPGKFNWATSVVRIDADEGEILRSFSPNHRQSIRKSIAANVIVDDLPAQEVAAYSEGHVAMFARRGIAKSLEDTRRLVEGFQALAAGSGGTEAFLLRARHPDTEGIIGGGIFYCSGDTCNYYHGYVAKMEKPLPVLHLVLWEAMLRAKSLGCSRFDLTGISLDDTDQQLQAVNNFKRWFRGEILTYPQTVIIPLYRVLTPLLRLVRHRI